MEENKFANEQKQVANLFLIEKIKKCKTGKDLEKVRNEEGLSEKEFCNIPSVLDVINKKNLNKYYKDHCHDVDLNEDNLYSDIVCDIKLKNCNNFKFDHYFFNAYQKGKNELCQRILNLNYFENRETDFISFPYTFLKDNNEIDIIFNIFKQFNVSECVKLIMLFACYTNVPQEFQDYIEDNLKLHVNPNYHKLVKYCIKNTYIFELLHKDIDVNNEELDKVLINNTFRFCYSNYKILTCKELTEYGYDFNRIKNKLLERICSNQIKYEYHFDFIKYLVELGAKLQFKDRKNRKTDSQIAIKYLRKNNIIN